MKNKLVIIGVISIFLLNGITTTAINIENNDDSFESKEPKYHDENINDIFYKEVDNSKKINYYTNKDGVDLTFKKNYVWWSPAPMYDDAEFFCYQYFIYNLGNEFGYPVVKLDSVFNAETISGVVQRIFHSTRNQNFGQYAQEYGWCVYLTRQ